jgi:hypothetical protein
MDYETSLSLDLDLNKISDFTWETFFSLFFGKDLGAKEKLLKMEIELATNQYKKL